MWRKMAKVGAVKTDRNRSRRGRKVGVSCMCGLLVARGPGRGATSRIIPRREEVAIPHAYPATGQSAKPEVRIGRSLGDLSPADIERLGQILKDLGWLLPAVPGGP